MYLTDSGDDSSQNQEQNDNQQKHTAANIHFELLLVTHPLRREYGKSIKALPTQHGLFAAARTVTLVRIRISIDLVGPFGANESCDPQKWHYGKGSRTSFY